MNQEVYVVEETNSDWWYGVCDGQVGYFPPNNVQSIKVAFKAVSYTHLTLPTIYSV